MLSRRFRTAKSSRFGAMKTDTTRSAILTLWRPYEEDRSGSTVHGRFSAGGGAAGDRRRAQHSAGGPFTGGSEGNAGQLGHASAQGRADNEALAGEASDRAGGGGHATSGREFAAEAGEGDFKKSRGVLREGVDVKYAWIVSQRDQYSIPMMCELLSVSRSGLYQAMHRPGTTGSAEEERIVEQIRRAQRKHRGR